MRRHVAVKGRRGLYWSETKTGKTYEVAYKDRDGKRHFKTTGPNLEDAINEQALLTVKLGKGEKGHYAPATFAAVAEEWAEARLDRLAEGSQKKYRSALDNHLIKQFGSRKIRAVSTDDIAHYLARITRLDGKPMSGAGKAAIYVVLYSVFEYAANSRRGYIPSNPCDSLEAGERPQITESDKRAFTQHEAQQIVACAEPWLRPVLITGMWTGMRPGELLGLKWDNIDFEEDTIHVVGQMLQTGSYSQTKGKAVRDVPLLPPVRAALFELETRFKGGWVFMNSKGNHVHYSSASLAFRTAREAAGLDKKLSLHTCRHTFASALLRDGKDVTWVSRLLGHKSPKVTLETYAHVVQRDNRNQEAALRLREALGDLG